MSSRAGRRARCARLEQARADVVESVARSSASSMSRLRATWAIGNGCERTVVPPSKLPVSVTPKMRAASAPSSSPSTSRSCAGVHTKYEPSPRASRRPGTTRIRHRAGASSRSAWSSVSSVTRRQRSSPVSWWAWRYDAGELGVVVQHLLEVRDRPRRVDGVAVEAAADLVVDAAAVHAVERQQRGVEQAPVTVSASGGAAGSRCAAGCGNFGAAPKPPWRASVWATSCAAAASRFAADDRPRREHGRFERAAQLRRGLGHLVAAVAVHARRGVEHVVEAAQALAIDGREVRAAEVRLAVGREEDGHRPAAVTADRHHRLHVDGVDVGPLLAVHLDVDEQLVHQRGDALVLERLVRHDVAPVARAVADAQQDGPVLGARAARTPRPPGVPVHRVVGVLQQVRAGLTRRAGWAPSRR